MKKRLHSPLAGILFGICSMLSSDLQATEINPDKPYWQDVQVVSVNKEYPRSSFMTYDNRTDALTGKFENSRYYKLINGTWKFFFVDSYKDLPANITSPETSTTSWDDIQVPGNWEVQGHGVAIYTNHGYEFKARNPQPPLQDSALHLARSVKKWGTPQYSNGYICTSPEQNPESMFTSTERK